MSANQNLSYKVYLNHGVDGEQIRRFSLEQNMASSYCYLNETLKKVFPCLNNKHINIYWKDSDGDLIAVSSDDELIIALTELIDESVKKFYILPNSSQGNDPAAPMDINDDADDFEENNFNIHKRIICDGCDGPVIGHRYKCLHCVDYDLCSNCEHSGIHSEHLMLRIPSVGDISLFGKNKKANKQLHKMAKKAYKRNLHQTKIANRFSEIVLRNLSNGDSPFLRPTQSNENFPSFNVDDAIPPSTSAERIVHMDCSNSVNDHKKRPFKIADARISVNCDEIMNTLANSLDTVLSNIAVDNDNTSQTTQTKSAPPDSKRRRSEPDGNDKKNRIGSFKDYIRYIVEECTKDKSCVNNEASTSSQTNDVESQNGAAAYSLYPKIPSENLTTSENDGIRVSPIYESNEKSNEEQNEYNQGEWTILPDVKTIFSNNGGAIPKQKKEVGNNSGGGDGKATNGTHSDKVDDCLIRMLAMGFTNEGDWLRSLIQNNNGDIQNVIDTLLPFKDRE